MIFGELFSPTDLAVVVIVVLLLFGGKKLPQLARSLGTASSEFKKGLEETQKPGDKGTSQTNGDSNPTVKDS
ncbi:sec-independent protein translocase protein TatA [Ferrithrix thermotolerans DSM 19514]|jgi:sec-independent protein translocase protein TatA|uniref:Sec-independent protein translocase protein TatA n=1 Tax=Ferrithrix thermotolerans DSM 19514 TaxID=1121881 RepID=A0A1M4VBU2_9ACTN|nr:twin-arginine translocase TatA/TatE family subunit [Ferrithrix thermotolerans]SHE66383.1 sec-independent protein translocase protein TatA [Ferrithrix thermotolerans DSM 19514]